MNWGGQQICGVVWWKRQQEECVEVGVAFWVIGRMLGGVKRPVGQLGGDKTVITTMVIWGGKNRSQGN